MESKMECRLILMLMALASPVILLIALFIYSVNNGDLVAGVSLGVSVVFAVIASYTYFNARHPDKSQPRGQDRGEDT